MIRFGTMSTVLLLGALYGGLFAALLWNSRHNQRANRYLAVLLVVIALQMLPYIMGYAGFYDAFPWLSYLPYEASWAIGPLLYGYVSSLYSPPSSRRWRWHFAPVAVQLAYYCSIFPHPLPFKDAWNTDVHVPFVLPIEQLLTLVSIAVYWLLSLRHYRGYQRWLEHSVSDREDHHIEWVRNFLIALGLTLILWVALVAWDRWVAKLNYFEQFPFYLWLAVLAYYLGTEGYRHARHHYPLWQQVSHCELTAFPMVAPQPLAAVPAREAVDLSLRAHKWRERLAQAEWWRDPKLSLHSLARHLGTNTSDLSRAINEGMGQNFNELINRMRVDAVKEALAQPHQPQGLLELAFAAGFSSKASFNRCFKLYTGQTPSAYRQSALPTV